MIEMDIVHVMVVIGTKMIKIFVFWCLDELV